jgi:uncharacterized protein YdeI (YjbR/CyaY-like superfamily)
MEITVLLEFTQRQQLRNWLQENHATAKECWVVLSRSKNPPAGVLPYLDVVEEALCFGWIDSTIKHIDPLHRAQRFTPRKPGSPYSQPNIERLQWLDRQGLLHPSVRDVVLPTIMAPYIFPEDILAELRQDENVWAHFSAFPDGYKRIRVAYIDAARKRPAEFQRRLASFLKKTRENQRISGFGGIEKYY